MEQEAYRHVPYDIEVEQALLGAILVDNRALEARFGADPKPEHFYDPLHQRLYEVMSTSFERGGMVLTPLTLHAAMKADPGLRRSAATPISRAWRRPRRRCPMCAILRASCTIWRCAASLIRIGEDIVNTAYEAPHEKPPKAQIEEAEKALYRVSETSKYGDGPIDFAESLRRTVELAEKAQARGGRISGLSRAFPTSTRCSAACSPPT